MSGLPDAEASGRQPEERPPLRTGSRTSETSSATRMIPETLFQSPASRQPPSVHMPTAASHDPDDSEQHLPWALRAALQQQHHILDRPGHFVHQEAGTQPRPETAHPLPLSAASHHTSSAQQNTASPPVSGVQPSWPEAQAQPANDIFRLDSWGSRHDHQQQAAAPRQSVVHSPSLDSWASADATSFTAASLQDHHSGAAPADAPHTRSQPHSVAQSQATSQVQSQAGSQIQSNAQSHDPSAAPSRSSSMPQHDHDVIRVSAAVMPPEPEQAASRHSIGALPGNQPLSSWQQQPPRAQRSLLPHASSTTPATARWIHRQAEVCCSSWVCQLYMMGINILSRLLSCST